MLERMIRAARLEADVYEEVEADTTATPQAMLVVILVAVATGIGALGIAGVAGLIFGMGFGLAYWAIWAYTTYIVGVTVFNTPQTEATWGQLARTTGFAQSPGMLRVFAVIPGIGSYVFLAVGMWQLVAMVIAVRQALDYQSTWRALGVVVVGFVALAAIQGVLRSLL